MEKTKVDDMLIEMISPKVKEIEEKFSQGKGLTQDDINTLLLKSQYNHINHLDEKLDETVDLVHTIKNEFDVKFNNLKNEFATLENKFATLENKFDLLEQKIETTIQKALNKNMMILIIVMGFFLTLSKIIDKF